MRAVIPKLLWIGNALDARDIKTVLGVGVTAIIDLAIEEPSIQFPRDIVYCRFPLIDGEGNSPPVLRAAIQMTAHFVRSEISTLVACSAGMSRSPAIVAAALAARREDAICERPASSHNEPATRRLPKSTGGDCRSPRRFRGMTAIDGATAQPKHFVHSFAISIQNAGRDTIAHRLSSARWIPSAQSASNLSTETAASSVSSIHWASARRRRSSCTRYAGSWARFLISSGSDFVL